ncbi:MAG TPA: VanZ family protein [Candidatus Ruthenibacterium merdigallinarum]|nr:VanZ family protein [Candidatus Ruthenibacterium merdigallinarum]
MQGKVPARLWAARIALSVAVCALACFIWGNSLASGPASSQVSGTVTQRVNDALQAVSPGASVTEHFVRKAAHFSEFALLGALAAAWVRAWGLRLARALGWALLAGMAVALADETLQLFSPGRSASPADVWLDFAGFCAGTALAAALMAAVRRLQRRS